MWHCDEGMGWWMVFGGLSMLVFWGGAIALAVWGFKRLTGGRSSETGTSHKRSPLDIAKERYASGQISRDEFEQIKRDVT